ncbi:MAG: glycosyltransferase [Pseudomonadales bacterium]
MARSLKALILIGSLRGGGAERQVRYLAARFAALNVDLTIALLEKGSQEQHIGVVPIVCLRSPKPSWASAAIRFRRLASSVDVVYSFMDVANVFAVVSTAGLNVARVWGLRNSGVTQGLVARSSFTLSRILSRNADSAICNSQAVQNFYAEAGFKPQQWAVIANGVSVADFNPNHRVRQLEINGRTLDLDGTIVGMIARADGFKRHDLFFGMVAQLRDRFPEVAWLIAGLGTADSGGPLASQMRDSGVAESIVALGEVSDVPSLVASLDIAVCSSEFEGSSNSILEGLASAVPVVSFAVGDADAMLSSCGVVVQQRSVAALADAVASLLDHPERRLALGAAGRRVAVERYSVEHMVQRTKSVLEQVCAFESDRVS